MAWQLKVTAVSGTETQMVGDPPVATEFDLTATGRWRVHLVYFDSAAPSTILYEHDFIFQADKVNAAQALVEARTVGAKVRDARALVTTLQAQIGTVFQV
jgi:hypothetical protein